ncbi:MAG: hypothetical protein ABJL99_14225 [Aliishimia sp.]
MKLDTWNSLPEDVQQVNQEVADEYREIAANSYKAGGEASLAKAVEGGAIISELSEEKRLAYAQKLPEIGREWAGRLDAQGKPGTQVLVAYMRL